LPLLAYLVPLLLGYGWNSLNPGTPNVPGLAYDGRKPDEAITAEWFGTGVVVVPLQARMRAYLESGDLPLWNPYQGLGQPFAAQGEGGPYYPLAIVRALLPYSVGNYVTVLGIYVAGIALYFFLRGLGLSEVAALFGGMAFELSGAVNVHLARPNFADQLCMLPVLLWAAELAMRRRTAASYAVLIVVAGVHLIAGHIQMALVNAVLLVVFCVVYASCLHWRLAARARHALMALGAFALGNALAGFYLLPVAEAINLSVDVRTEGASFLQPPFANGLAMFFPILFGPWYHSWLPDRLPSVPDWDNLYASSGATVLMLVVLGWVVGRRALAPRARRLFVFFSLAGAVLLLRFLTFPPVAAVNLLPILGRQTPKHANGATVVCLTIAAALAVEVVRARPDLRVRGWMALAFGGVAASVLMVIGQQGGFGAIAARSAEIYVPVTLFIVGVVLLTAWTARRWARLSPSGAGVLLIGLAAGELLVYVPLGNTALRVLQVRLVLLVGLVGVGLLLALGRRAAAAGAAAGAVLVYALVVAVPSVGLPQQVDVVRPPAYMGWLKAAADDQYRAFGIEPDFSSVAAIQDVDAVGPLAPREYGTFVGLAASAEVASQFYRIGHFWLTIGLPGQDVYDLADYLRARAVMDWVGVRYVVLDKAVFQPRGRTDDQQLLAPDAGLDVVYEDSVVRVLESASARPKAEFWDSARVYPGQSATLAELAQQPESILGPPGVEAKTAPTLPTQGSDQPSPVALDSYSPNEVRLSLTAPRQGLVVLKDAYFPGWQATVDGEPSDVLRVNGMVRGVVISGPGEHSVVFSYRPASFVRGVLLAGAVAVLVVTTLLSAWNRGVPRWSVMCGLVLLLALLVLTGQAYFGSA
jgi:Bacterial membrane protein YfhO